MVWFGKHDSGELAGLRAEVESLQSRLASDVSSLDAGDSALCRQALNDASERATAAGGLMSRATTAEEMRVALRIVVEGLQATRVVRDHQGLSLGPDLPDVTSSATVQAPTQVVVGDQQMTAAPGYHPQQPHYFGGGMVGGTQVPGGYYKTPFWKKAMMLGGAVAGGEMLGGLLSGGDAGWGGGGYADDDRDTGFGGGDSSWGGDGGGGDGGGW
jgi:hypothetical protein